MEGFSVRGHGIAVPQVLPGVIWWLRTVFVNGQPWALYQSDAAGARLVLHPYDSLIGYAVTDGGNSYAPDAVQLPSGVLRVAWAIRQSEAPGEVAIRDIDLAPRRVDLLAFTAPSTVPPPLTPDPKPTPPPTPTVECGTVPAVGQALLKDLAAKFPALIKSANDDERRAWVLKAAEQLAFSVSPSWGTKRAGEGRPPSKDAIARMVDGALCSWDIVSGTTRELVFGQGEVMDAAQRFIPVTPTNHLAGTTTPPPPPPPADVERLRTRVAELERDLATAVGKVAALERSLEEDRADAVQAQHRVAELEAERDSLKAQLDAEREKPATCEVRGVPWWARQAGVRASCVVIR